MNPKVQKPKYKTRGEQHFVALCVIVTKQQAAAAFIMQMNCGLDPNNIM